MQQIIQYKTQKPGFKQVPGASTIQILIAQAQNTEQDHGK